MEPGEYPELLLSILNLLPSKRLAFPRLLKVALGVLKFRQLLFRAVGTGPADPAAAGPII